MRKLKTAQYLIAYLVAIIVFQCSLQLQLAKIVFINFPYANFVLASILSALSGFLSSFVAGWVLKFKFVQSAILGDKYIGSTWHLKTSPIGCSDTSLIILDAIMEVDYDLASGEQRIKTIRFKDGNSVITQSEVVRFRTTGPTIRYMNRFVLRSPNPTFVKGVADGGFLINQGQPPISLSVSILLDDESDKRNQNGNLIPDAIEKIFRKKFGEQCWRQAYLESEGLIYDSFPCDAYEKDLVEIISSSALSNKEREEARFELNEHRSKMKNHTGVLGFLKRVV